MDKKIFMPKVVLVHPEIAPNTGNVARTCAANHLELHLIRPLGFRMTDPKMKRAGLDYWNELNLTIHPSWEAFQNAENGPGKEDLMLFSSKATQNLWEAEVPRSPWLVFGSETAGLPTEITSKYRDRLFFIPMLNPAIRCLNLANSAAIGIYEVLRRGHLHQ